MIFPKAKKIAKELGWQRTNNSVFGPYKGYFFNVGDGNILSTPQFKYITAITDNLTEEQKRQIKIELDDNKKVLKFSTYEIEDESIFIQFIENLSYTKLQTVYSLLDFLVDLFKKINISEQNKCHNCGTKCNIDYYDLNDSGLLLCDICFRQIENSYDEVERERLSEENNYLAAFLGSIIFSIPGIIVWILVAVYLERLASAMAIVIASLGIKGYYYFKGRHDYLTKYLIVISNILCILIANVSTIIVMLVNEGITISQSYTEIQNNEVVKVLLRKNLMISFILAFFTWIWLFIVLKDEKMVIKFVAKCENQKE